MIAVNFSQKIHSLSRKLQPSFPINPRTKKRFTVLAAVEKEVIDINGFVFFHLKRDYSLLQIMVCHIYLLVDN